MTGDSYAHLMQLYRDYSLLGSVEELMSWDQEVLMPPRAAENRATQLAMLAGLAHERLISDELRNALAKVGEPDANDFVAVTNVREIKREHERAAKLPTDLVKEIARVTSLAKETWARARKESNFDMFAPHLDRILELKREVAAKIGWKTEPYDALMDEFEPNAKSADVQAVFDDLKKVLVPMVQAITKAKRQPDAGVLTRAAPKEAQAALNRKIAAALGFNFDAGRLDISTHPFCGGNGPLDVRMTTRYDEKYMPMSLFGVMHETGHGLYEQGLDPAHAHTPMARSVSLGIHESQSRMWENQVGRSRAFWEHFFPALQEQFPSYRDVTLDQWHFAINTVKPSFIRVEADEVTYGLHIMLRFGLERQMIAGKLATRDVPEAWNAGMKELIGITPPDDAQGCLQDIHWSMGIFGYFPTYQLGNLYSAQFYAQARKALPDLENQIRRGELLPLREWLRANIHKHGRRYRANELVKVVTGSELSSQPYVEYLNAKFKPLYQF